MHVRQQRQLFTDYWHHRVREADAITPGQKLALLDRLERELHGQDENKPGQVRVPRHGGGSVLLPATHPLVQAALEGRPVAAGGTVIQLPAETPGERLRNLSDGQKLGLLALLTLLPLLLVGLLLARRGPGEAEAAALLDPTPAVTLEATAILTPTMAPTETPLLVAEVVTGTATPPVATPTPYSIALISGRAAPDGNDPASIEIDSFSYILSTGQVENGVWTPQGAEWLAGTVLRRVIAVPFEPALANTVAALRAGAVIRVRLRSGEIVRYRVVEVRRQQRQGIEVLADRRPSLALVLHGEPAAERWVVVAEAIQSPQPFTVYTAGPPEGFPPGGDPAAPGLNAPPLPTPLPTGTTTVITSTRVVTHTEVGLRLSVGTCERAARIGEQKPPRRKQQFLTCEVTLTALEEATGPVPFSADALAISEENWILTQLDWWPPAVRVSRALRSGTLTPGRSTSGRVAGIVTKAGSSFLSDGKSRPVLVWEQGGVRYLIQLEAEEGG